MNSWHSFSPNGRWLVFSSKSRSPYTQMFLTHIDGTGNDSPPIYVENSTAANRAVNIPEFVNIPPDGIAQIDVPAADFYRVVDEAIELTGNGDVQAALARWKAALALDPNDARAHNGMGVVQGQAGQLDAAAASFQRAVTIEGDFFEAWYNLGVVLARIDRTADAIAAWQNTVRIRPRFPQGHENLGFALYRSGRYAEALGELQRALDGDPERLFALTLEARLLATCPDAGLRDGPRAVELARRAQQLSGGKSASVLDTLAAALAANGQFDDAASVEKDALTYVSAEGAGTGQHRSSHPPIARVLAHLKSYQDRQAVHEPIDADDF
jgi:tetratricopeptide (TPR) repeat protein